MATSMKELLGIKKFHVFLCVYTYLLSCVGAYMNNIIAPTDVLNSAAELCFSSATITETNFYEGRKCGLTFSLLYLFGISSTFGTETAFNFIKMLQYC